MPKSPFFRLTVAPLFVALAAVFGCSSQDDNGGGSTAKVEAPVESTASESAKAASQESATERSALPAFSPPKVELPAAASATSPPEPAAKATVKPVEQPVAEPTAKPDVPEAGLGLPPTPAQAKPAPSAMEPRTQAPGAPGVLPNPLRNGRNLGLEQSPVNPPVAGQGPAEGKPGASKAKSDGGTAKDPPPGKEKPARAPFDAVKENGPIFVEWPKPKLALVITGRQDGYLEPCGCAGMDRMKGGLSRRYSFLKDLRERGWPVVAVDVGGLSKGFGRQAQLKFQMTAEAMKQMRYDAIGLGTSDLQLPAVELAADVAGSSKQQPTPFLSANVALFGFNSEITPQKRVVEAGGIKVGITSVLGATYQKQINNPDITMVDAVEALTKLTPELKKESNLMVLLAHTTKDESLALAAKFPDFDVVVTAGGPSEPPIKVETLPGGKNCLIEVGEKGMNAIVLGVFEDPQQAYRYQRVPLDSRFASSREMKKLMKEYQVHLQFLGFSGLGIRAIPHPAKEQLGGFVGSAKCLSCHEKSYDIWRKTGHAKAHETLVKADPPRQFDPECISCHVVGWHPTQFFPYQGGYESGEKTPPLAQVGCESCHGPGETHVTAEMGSDEALKKKLQKAVVITKADAEKHACVSCHDGDNSPEFKFDTYWPKIEHKEK